MGDADRPFTLAIETSNPSAGSGDVALGAVRADGTGEILGVERLAPSSRHDDALMPAIDALMRRAGVEPRRLRRVAVSIGPGGFTGLRIAVTTAKVISEAAGAGCVGVPSALVAVLGAEPSRGRLGVALASKRETAWIALIDRNAPPADQAIDAADGCVMSADDLAAAHARSPVGALIGDQHLPESFRSWASSAGVAIAPPAFRAEACFRASLAMDDVDALELAPLYPRAPEAVSNWRALRGD